MVRQIQIKAPSYGMPGRVVAVENGQVVWAGPITDFSEGATSIPFPAKPMDRFQTLIGRLTLATAIAWRASISQIMGHAQAIGFGPFRSMHKAVHGTAGPGPRRQAREVCETRIPKHRWSF